MQKPDSAYHVAALNNLYAGADPNGPMSDASTGSTPATAGSEAWEERLDSLLAQLQTLADEAEAQPDRLLVLLRRLEGLHRTIQDGPFRASLPADRGELFNLLQSMERSGGWPYIPRLQLRTFMDLLQSGEAGTALAA
ncbi:MAG: hypothetical protein RLZZ219_1656 [Cyanobacteriota bacterium]